MKALTMGLGFVVLSVVFLPGIWLGQSTAIPMRNANGQVYYLTPNGPMPVRPPADRSRIRSQTPRTRRNSGLLEQPRAQTPPKLGVALQGVQL